LKYTKKDKNEKRKKKIGGIFVALKGG